MPTVTPTSALALGNSGTSIGSPVVWNPSGVALGNSSIKSAFRGTGSPRDSAETSFVMDSVNAPSSARTVVGESFPMEADHRDFTFTNDEVNAPSHPYVRSPAHMTAEPKDSDGGLY